MENNFIIEIEIGTEKLIFDAKLDTIGFLHRVLIKVSGINVIFEPDEERNYRAIISPNSVNKITDADKQIIIFLGEKLESLKGGIGKWRSIWTLRAHRFHQMQRFKNDATYYRR